MAKKRIDPQELYDTLSFYHVPFPDKKIDSFVYFISDGEYVKIGKGFPIQRMKGLQTGNQRELSLLFTIPVGEITTEERRNYKSPLFHRHDGVSYAEDMIHSFFRNSHLRGEWFDILDQIDTEEFRRFFGILVNNCTEDIIEYQQIKERRGTEK